MKYLPSFVLLPPLFALMIGAFAPSAGAADQEWITLGSADATQSWQGDGRNWTVAEDASLAKDHPADLIAKPGKGILVNLLHKVSEFSNLTSKQTFGDIEAHVEFLISSNSNAGVKFQGLYEIQIRDSHGKENLTASDCGGIYPRAELVPRYRLLDEGFPPRTNAAKPAGEWQTLEVVFQAPRFAKNGKKSENARFIRVLLNDQIIHENVELQWSIVHAWRTKDEVARGPLYLQGDHGPVAYRNIRVRPIGSVATTHDQKPVASEEVSEDPISPDSENP